MYNGLVLKNGLTIWVTQAEVDYINHKLAMGERFIDIPRLQQTYNVDSIFGTGINQIFYDVKVKGAEFHFTYNSVVAKTPENREYSFQGSWKVTKGQFDKALSFDDFIASQAAQSSNQ